MKATRMCIVLLLFSLLVTMGFMVNDSQQIGRINFILGTRGDVKINRAGYSQWKYARLFSPVYDGDRLKTMRESRCEIKLQKKGVIRVGENADFTLRYHPTQKKSSSILRKGRFWASIKGLFSKRRFFIRTPTAVCAVRGTVYRIDADSTTKVCVYDGAVDVGPVWLATGDSTRAKQAVEVQKPMEVPGPTEVPGPFEVSLDQWIQIVAGYQIEVRADGKYYKSKIDKKRDEDDDWVKWNKMRDEGKY